jgi:hypothetical protein
MLMPGGSRRFDNRKHGRARLSAGEHLVTALRPNSAALAHPCGESISRRATRTIRHQTWERNTSTPNTSRTGTLPGGMAGASESPLDAARREVREELGIEYDGGRLLVLDWASPHRPWDDGLMCRFVGSDPESNEGQVTKKPDSDTSESGSELLICVDRTCQNKNRVCPVQGPDARRAPLVGVH